MAYATVQDMVTAFGEAEMIRLSASPSADSALLDVDRIGGALTDASAVIDSYVRRRYATPLANVPDEIARACRVLARYDLMTGDQREPTETARLMRKEVTDWLRDISTGHVLLDAALDPSSDESHAEAAPQRRAVFGNCGGDY